MKNRIPSDAYAIIIGAMKSGTSSLYGYLIQHPQVCRAKTKEPEFFSRNQQHGLQVDNYENIWKFKRDQHRIALEASTGYSKYPTETNIPERILNYGINPKFIYVVRNPIDRIVSQYVFSEKVLHQKSSDILSEHGVALSRYHMQLEEYRKCFSKKRILIVDFSELTNHPQKTLDKVCDFLNIASFEPKINRILNKSVEPNALKTFINTHLSGILRISPEWLKSPLRSLLIKEVVLERPTLSEDQINYLKQELSGDMAKFSEEYDFDVKQWGF